MNSYPLTLEVLNPLSISTWKIRTGIEILLFIFYQREAHCNSLFHIALPVVHPYILHWGTTSNCHSSSLFRMALPLLFILIFCIELQF
jgi:hypothetical protein